MELRYGEYLIISELTSEVGTKAYRDDILRLVQLISATK